MHIEPVAESQGKGALPSGRIESAGMSSALPSGTDGDVAGWLSELPGVHVPAAAVPGIGGVSGACPFAGLVAAGSSISIVVSIASILSSCT